PPACKSCQSVRLERIMSRFAAPKSEEARLESLADPSSFGDVDENDPKSMARFMKKMGREMGEDVGDDLDEALEETGNEPTEMDTTDID
ncbi:MAG: FmdB family zinc ribbon protein, partial [Nitrospiraceae bacterium]